MTKIINDTFLRTIRKEPVAFTPIWLMRQAGRYLPEYKALRAKAGSFLNLCKNPELSCVVTLQPLQRFDLDAAILFSDILTIPDALGLGLGFKEGEGPFFTKPLRSLTEIQKLRELEPEKDLQYVYKTIQNIQHELSKKVPLIGFCGSPWTLACYIVEGNAHKKFPAIQTLMKSEPPTAHILLDKLANAVAAHLNMQIKSGVDAVMIFDTWGGLLDDVNYKEFSFRYIQQIIHQLEISDTRKVPVILFTKGGKRWLELQAESGCDVVGLDYDIPLNYARNKVGDKVTLQGNLEPKVLLGTFNDIEKEVERILSEFGEGSGHIFNLSHGVTPDVPPENVAFLVDAVHRLSRQYHR